MNPNFLSEFIDEEIYLAGKTYQMVETQPEESIISEPTENYTQQIEFYGKNENGIVILVNETKDKWMLPKEKMVIGTILSAINKKLKLEEGSVVNLANETGISLKHISGFFQPVQIIGFNIPEEFESTLDRDKVVEAENALCFLSPHSLTEIAMSREKKVALWQNFKTLFQNYG